MSFKVTDSGYLVQIESSYTTSYLGKYCALSLEFMNLLGIYKWASRGPSADVYY